MNGRLAPDGSLATPLRGLVGACLIVLASVVPAGAMDRITLAYGLREYIEFNDNLFFASNDRKKIQDGAFNTAPDLSLLHDDGKTRWLVRGSYRRESFIDNRDASGDYSAISGEFSRALSDRVTVSMLGGYTRSSSVILGRVGQEPGQREVVRPSRASLTKATFWSPSLTVFWSRKFRTDLTYQDNQGFSGNGLGTIDRSLTLNGSYALSARTVLQAALTGLANHNSGVPCVGSQDSNVLLTLFGFSHVFSPRLTMDISGGPIWTKNVNFPDRVTLLRNALVKDESEDCALYGTCKQLYLKEPDRKVKDVSVSLGVRLGVNYDLDRDTRVNLLVTRSTDSGEGVSGTQVSDMIRASINRSIGTGWSLNVSGAYLRRSSVLNDLAILSTKDPDTGQQEALDRRSFGLPKAVSVNEAIFGPVLNYRFNRWLSAFGSWQWVRQRQQGAGGETTEINRVTVGLTYRGEQYY